MREIDLEGGEASIRVYDTSGPYTDPAATIDIRAGLEQKRREWIMARGDVEEYAAREVKPEDNGQLGPDRSGGVPASQLGATRMRFEAARSSPAGARRSRARCRGAAPARPRPRPRPPQRGCGPWRGRARRSRPSSRAVVHFARRPDCLIWAYRLVSP